MNEVRLITITAYFDKGKPQKLSSNLKIKQKLLTKYCIMLKKRYNAISVLFTYEEIKETT